MIRKINTTIRFNIYWNLSEVLDNKIRHEVMIEIYRNISVIVVTPAYKRPEHDDYYERPLEEKFSLGLSEKRDILKMRTPQNKERTK